MSKIELEVLALSHSITHSHSYAVVLGEVEGSRRIPIVIGGFEAQAIAIALEYCYCSCIATAIVLLLLLLSLSLLLLL